MVESRLLPARDVVTALALFTQRAVVTIVIAVARHTCGGCIAKFLSGGVAGSALQRRMPTLQCEISAVVAKGVAVEADDVAVATDVIGMALTTSDRLARSGAQSTMKTGSGLNVRRHRVVTLDAEFVLCLFGKGDVALVAVGLQLGVRLRQLARHQQRLQCRLGRCRCGANSQQHQQQR